MECNRLYYAARACESRRAYSARCVRLDSAPHAALCDSLKLDTSRYLVHNIVIVCLSVCLCITVHAG